MQALLLSEQTINQLSIGWLAIAIILIPLQLWIAAPYGRHTKTKGWGPMIPNRVGWIIMEIFSPVIVCFFFFSGPNSHNLVFRLMIALWVLHYINRTLIWPFRIRDSGKKMPLTIPMSAIFFNLVNGFLNGYFLGYLAPAPDSSYLLNPHAIAGIILFFTGVFINIKSDNILIGLRKPGETGYKIPRGFLFNYVSSPNLLGEMIEWAGFALLCWNLPALSFAVWTICNLGPRAIHHHHWCHQKFPEYPKNRKALLPFLL